MVGCGRVSDDPGRPGDQRADEVHPAARAGQRDRQRAEELQRHRQAEADPVDRGVQRQVHRARTPAPSSQHRPPLPPGERAQPGPADRQQHDPGHPLPDGDDARPARARERPAPRAPRRAGWRARCRASAPRRRTAGRPAEPSEQAQGRIAARAPDRHGPSMLGPMHSQNACMRPAIRSGYGCGAATPALPGRDRRRRQLHRRRRSSWASPRPPSRARSRRSRLSSASGCCAVPPASVTLDHRGRAGPGPGPAAAGRGRRPGSGGHHRPQPGCASATPGRPWAAHTRRVPAPLGRPLPGRRAPADPHQLRHRRPGRGHVRPRRASAPRPTSAASPARSSATSGATAPWPPTTRGPGAGRIRLAELGDRDPR